MRYYLARDAALKHLETPSVYRIGTDELYELDEESFGFLSECCTANGCEAPEDDFITYCMAEGLLTTGPVAVLRPPVLPAPSPSLRYLELQVTDRCNLRCRHCYIGNGGGIDLPLEAIRKVTMDFQEMQGLRLLITGGEPLLHPEFHKINALLPSLMMRKVLFTNGLLLTDEVIGKLHVDEVQVSIDGMEESHDGVRGPGSFSRALAALKRCTAAGMDVSVATMVTKRNLRDFPAMEETFRSLGVRDWTVDVPCQAGRMYDNSDLLVSPAEGGPLLGYGFGGGFHGGTSGFACGLHLAAVSARGGVARCTFYSDRPAGQVSDGLRSCWSKIRPVRLEELACACRLVEECRGGCRYRAESLEGAGGRDLYKCYLHDIID